MSYWQVFIIFGLVYQAGKIINILHLTNYCEGIIVIFQLLSILLVRSCQKLTVKIGLRFFSDLNSNFYEFLKLQPFSGISYNKQRIRSRDDRHAAHSPSAREGLPGVIRGLPGGIREVCGSGSLGTRGATGGIRGSLARHLGTQRTRASGRYSGFSGHVAARRAPGGSLLFRHSGTDGKLGRHPGEILPVRGIRRHVAAREESGRGGVSLGTREHVAGSEGVSKKASGGIRGRASGT